MKYITLLLYKTFTNKRKPLLKYLPILSLLIACQPRKQPAPKNIVLEEISDINSLFSRTRRDSISLPNEQADFNFFKERYYLLYGLPDTLTKKEYRNETIKTWMLDTTQDLSANWYETYTYDDKGRLEHFFYSSCFICSSFPFEYNIIYNQQGQVEKVYDNKYSEKTYQFYYREKGNIEKIEIFERDTLSKRITRID